MGSPLLKKLTQAENSDIFSRLYPLDQALESPNSLVARAVGFSEGNRTLQGGSTDSYWGHPDPGNGVRNLGSFSVQIRNRQISTPLEADQFWLAELRKLDPRYKQAAMHSGISPDTAWIFLNVFDLYTQAPAAVTASGGLLERLSNKLLTPSDMIQARVKSFFEPNGRLNAPGFGNNLARLTADQTRRVKAIETVLRYNSNIAF